MLMPFVVDPQLTKKKILIAQTEPANNPSPNPNPNPNQ